jgi:hypothetical protein
MEVKFDLGLIKNPFNPEAKRRMRFFFEFSFGGQWYRKPDEGYMAYTIGCGGNKGGSLSIKEALKLYDKGSEVHSFLSDMEYIMKDDMLKFVKCIPQAKKLFITRTLKKYRHLVSNK